MSYQVANWIGGWADVAAERTGQPVTGGHNRSAAQDITADSLRSSTKKLWQHLWAKAHAPCPHCGKRKR